jgi:hypothetical protein
LIFYARPPEKLQRLTVKDASGIKIWMVIPLTMPPYSAQRNSDKRGEMIFLNKERCSGLFLTGCMKIIFASASTCTTSYEHSVEQFLRLSLIALLERRFFIKENNFINCICN